MADEQIKDETVSTSQAQHPSNATSVTSVSSGARPPGVQTADGARQPDLPDFATKALDSQSQSIDLLGDVELNVKVELGRCRMAVEDVLRLAEGAVVELDRLAGDPVDVLVNDRLVARGEVLVLNDTFCVRVNEIVTDEPAAP